MDTFPAPALHTPHPTPRSQPTTCPPPHRFGNNPVFMHGIQLIPFTPVSEALLPRAWVSEAYPLATAGLATLPPGSDGWHHFMAMERAILDPAGAWSTATVSLANTQFYGAWGSHPRSVVLHWIATRPGAGGARRLLRG